MSVSPVQRDVAFAAEVEAPVRAGAERAELTVRAVAAGFNHHLTKPPDPGALLDLLPRR